MSHIWIVEKREMYTNNSWEIFEFFYTRESARCYIKAKKALNNPNSNYPSYTYRVKKYVMVD